MARPTEYKSEFGEDLIQLMATGLWVTASAATHVWQAYQVAGLTPEAFAKWLRRVARDVEQDGERSVG